MTASPQDAVELVRLAIELASCEKSMRSAIGQVVSLHGLNENAFFILMLCHDHLERPLPQTEMARTVGLSPAQLSHLVEQLRQEGLLEPQRDAKDRRRQFWSLTESGHQRLDEILHLLPKATSVRPWPVPPRVLLEGLREMVGTLRESIDPAPTVSSSLLPPESKVA